MSSQVILYLGDFTRKLQPWRNSTSNKLIFEDFEQYTKNNESLFKNVTGLWVELGHNIDKNIIEKFPNLKLLATSTTGVTHLNIDKLNASNIEVLTLNDYPEILDKITSTAELSWALLLAVWRKLPKRTIDNDVSKIKHIRYEDLSMQLDGKQIAIIGYGRIGRKLAIYSRAFGMKIRVYDPYVDFHGQESSEIFFAKSLSEAINDSDVIILSASKLNSSEPILNREIIKDIKIGAVVINTARGSLWDEEAITERLRLGYLGGIGVDVYASEEVNKQSDTSQSILEINPCEFNIIRTAHVGGATSDALELVTNLIYDEICLKLSNK